jgi:hypothetical protein
MLASGTMLASEAAVAIRDWTREAGICVMAGTCVTAGIYVTAGIHGLIESHKA